MDQQQSKYNCSEDILDTANKFLWAMTSGNKKAALRCSVWDRALTSKDGVMYTIFYTCILARSITNHLTELAHV